MRVPSGGPGRTVSLVLSLLALALAVPTAAAGVTGVVRYDLHSPEDALVQARVNLTGEAALDVRERVDRDDDGSVSSLEAAGARLVIEDRLEEDPGAYTLDGAPSETERVSVDTEGLEGPVDETRLELEVRAETRASPGQAPHVLGVHDPLANLTGETNLTYVVDAPGGYEIAQAEGFASVGDCRAQSAPGASNATVRLRPAEGACEDTSRTPVPAAGPALVLGGAALAAVALRRDR